MTELCSMKYSVAATAFISYWSRPVPVRSFTVFELCFRGLVRHRLIRGRKRLIGRRLVSFLQLSVSGRGYDFGED